MTHYGDWDFGLIAAQSISQGVINELRGGTFKAEAVSTLISKVFGQLSQGQPPEFGFVLVSAGGALASKAACGDAIQGALTARLVFLYNQQSVQKGQMRSCSGQMCRSAGNASNDHVVGATDDFLDNYNDMRDANTIGADKYFHCKANCEASQRGSVGERTAEHVSNIREWVDQNIKGDPLSASQADQRANIYGRQQGSSNPQGDCKILCSPFRPNGLDHKY